MAPVIFEKYNEITFYEPTEHFYPILLANQYDKFIAAEKQKTGRPLLSDVNERNQAISQTNFMKYVNYLSMNGHKPLIRSQFQDSLLQRDHWLQQEKQDMEKLDLVLQYLMEINHDYKIELDNYDSEIKSKADERNNPIVVEYNEHIKAAKKEVNR